jgi:hypothetical protein
VSLGVRARAEIDDAALHVVLIIRTPASHVLSAEFIARAGFNADAEGLVVAGRFA